MIHAADLARAAADKVRESAIPYVLGGRSEKGTDCINLVGWCVEELGGNKSDVPRGSNSAWRQAMSWRGTLQEAKSGGQLAPGALLFICDGPSDSWPDGDYGHAGVYVGRAGMEVVHASASRGGVYPSTLKNGWTHAAWLACVAYEEESGMTVLYEALVVTDGGSLNLRQGAGISYAKVGSAPCGARVEVLEDSNAEFWKVRYDGQVAWASAAYLASQADVVRIARADALAMLAALQAALAKEA